jgi:hypothetical protein
MVTNPATARNINRAKSYFVAVENKCVRLLFSPRLRSSNGFAQALQG